VRRLLALKIFYCIFAIAFSELSASCELNSEDKNSPFYHPKSIIYDNDNSKFIVVGKNYIYTSKKGIDWKQTAIDLTFNDVIKFNDRYIAVGDQDGRDGIWYSNDGENWKKSEFNFSTIIDTFSIFEKIHCTNEACFIVTNWGVLRKEHGETWKVQYKSPHMFLVGGIANNNNIYVIASGDGGYHSNGGVTWFRNSDQEFRPTRGVLWNGQQFFGVGGPRAQLSVDGIHVDKELDQVKVYGHGLALKQIKDKYIISEACGKILLGNYEKSVFKTQSIQTPTRMDIVDIEWSGKIFVAIGKYYINTKMTMEGAIEILDPGKSYMRMENYKGNMLGTEKYYGVILYSTDAIKWKRAKIKSVQKTKKAP
jgi:hypothetical protein